MDDLNHLLHCEQVALLQEQTEACAISRAAHRSVADGYGRRIREHWYPYRSGAIRSNLAYAPYPFGGGGVGA